MAQEPYTSGRLSKSRLVQDLRFKSLCLIMGVKAATLPVMDSDAILRALAEPHRQAMLRLVRDEPLSVGDIAQHFDITQQAVSQHLQVLREAGLVAVRKQGPQRLYLVRPEGLETLDAFLAELWPAGLERLKQAVEADRGA